MKRRHLESDAGRQVSSPAMLVERVRALGVAWTAGDEANARDELRHLAREADLLSKTSPLFVTGIEQRQADWLSKSHSDHSS